ncbi:hypothetical protein Pan44_51700 [Caulifigura coniformis]|uniref:Uncharacterized protein n=1 Tax=Caulifigura coniformis TaxID=2527983 RepID=A0A517SLV4_9PLAN|nr:hypothetical protein [Caulifigura coniformis]QDT57104.1 hypothetical protein Pan44_51700 [Caulifigura coniformis]
MSSMMARAFDDQRREQLFRPRPQPANQSSATGTSWQSVRNGEMPPLMFQLRFRDGRITSFAYSDLREIRFRDAGFIQLGLCGMSQRIITIEGRHLRELVELLGNGLVYWLQEADERDVETPETSPCITALIIEDAA